MRNANAKCEMRNAKCECEMPVRMRKKWKNLTHRKPTGFYATLRLKYATLRVFQKFEKCGKCEKHRSAHHNLCMQRRAFRICFPGTCCATHPKGTVYFQATGVSRNFCQGNKSRTAFTSVGKLGALDERRRYVRSWPMFASFQASSKISGKLKRSRILKSFMGGTCNGAAMAVD